MPANATRALVCRGVKRAALCFRQCERLWPMRGGCIDPMFSSSRGSAGHYLVFYCVFSSMSGIDPSCKILKMTAIIQLSFTCRFERLDGREIQR